MKHEIKLKAENDEQAFFQLKHLAKTCKEHFVRTTGKQAKLYRIFAEEIHYVREFEMNYIYVTYISEERPLTQYQETRKRNEEYERQNKPAQ